MSHKVFIFIPGFGQVISTPTFLASHALQNMLVAKGIAGGISSLSFPDIAELRSMALTIWYDTLPDVSHLLFIDSDMAFSPELVLDMLLFGEPVVGAIYPQRRMPQSWAGSGTGERTAERRAGFMKVEGVGMGCTLIRRDAITAMLERFPEMIDTRLDLHPAGEMLRQTGTRRLIRAFDKIDIKERGQVSEDLSFCLRWNACGGTVWANIAHRISHVGPYDYAGRYLDVIEGQQAQAVHAMMAAQQQQRIAAPVMVEVAEGPVSAVSQVAAEEAAGVQFVAPTPRKSTPRKIAIAASRKSKANGRAAHP